MACETGKSPTDDVEIQKRKVRPGTMSTLLKDFTEDVEVLGLKHVSADEESWLRRGLYLGLVLFGLNFAAYQVYRQVSLYLEYPQSVDVDVDYVPSTLFPKVIICNINPVSNFTKTFIFNFETLIFTKTQTLG